MKKRLTFFFTLLILSAFLVGCNSSNNEIVKENDVNVVSKNVSTVNNDILVNFITTYLNEDNKISSEVTHVDSNKGTLENFINVYQKESTDNYVESN